MVGVRTSKAKRCPPKGPEFKFAPKRVRLDSSEGEARCAVALSQRPAGGRTTWMFNLVDPVIVGDQPFTF